MSAEPTSPSPIAVFPLRARGPLVRGWIFVLGVLFVVIAGRLGGLPLMLAFHHLPWTIAGAAVGAALALWVMLGPVRRSNRPPAQPPTLRVEPTGLRVPKGARSAEEQWIPYESVDRLELLGLGQRAMVLIQAANRLYVFPARAFVNEADPAHFLAQARRALATHSPELYRKLVEQRVLSVAVGRVRPLATQLLLLLIGVIWAITLALGGATLPVLIRLGANAQVLDRDGQWFRLFTANFLHGGWLHIFLNALALATLGALVEQLFGSWRYVLVFLLSALGGSVASAIPGTHPLSVGISTALFGLFGAWAFVAVRFRSSLPPQFRRSRRWWLVQLGLNGGLSVAIPMIDWAAHLGGFLTGIVVTALVYSPTKDFRAPAGRLTKGAALILLTAFAAALAAGAQYALGPASFANDATRAVVELPRAKPDLLNEVAWETAINPASDAASLATARHAIDRAVAQRPNDFQFIDTSATVLHRQGEQRVAVEQQCNALRLCGACSERRQLQSQLARFLGAAADGGKATTPAALGAEWAADGLHLRPPATGPDGLHAYALLPGSRPQLFELEGQVAGPSTSVGIRGPTETSPVFACVEWGKPSGGAVQARAITLEPQVLARP